MRSVFDQIDYLGFQLALPFRVILKIGKNEHPILYRRLRGNQRRLLRPNQVLQILELTLLGTDLIVRRIDV